MDRGPQTALDKGEGAHAAARQIEYERRELPWVKVDKLYVFEGPDGKDPPNPVDDMIINHRGGGRGLYLRDPDGHILELLTVGWPQRGGRN